jgi:hypothetical protein
VADSIQALLYLLHFPIIFSGTTISAHEYFSVLLVSGARAIVTQFPIIFLFTAIALAGAKTPGFIDSLLLGGFVAIAGRILLFSRHGRALLHMAPADCHDLGNHFNWRGSVRLSRLVHL